MQTFLIRRFGKSRMKKVNLKRDRAGKRIQVRTAELYQSPLQVRWSEKKIIFEWEYSLTGCLKSNKIGPVVEVIAQGSPAL
jgi:hypothetical protein